MEIQPQDDQAAAPEASQPKNRAKDGCRNLRLAIGLWLPMFSLSAAGTPIMPMTAPPAMHGSITIVGDPEFIHQTQLALELLETAAPDAYQKVAAYVEIIEQSERSGMWAFEFHPRFAVGDPTAFFSVTWYASAIAHDATHSELFHRYLASQGAPVPESAWTGVEVERFCNSYQLDVLKRIGGTTEEIEHLEGQDGTHCDVDHDGDCDSDDYDVRDW